MLKRAKVPDNDIQSLNIKITYTTVSPIMKNLHFCLCEKHTEAADQLCGNRTADQILCFPGIDSKIPKLAKSEISR